jgi:hypothetical protein
MIYAGCFDDAGEFIYFGSCCGKLVKASPLARGHVKEWDLFRNELRSITIRDGKLSCIGIEGDAAIVDLATGEVLLKCPVKTMPYRRVAFTNHDGTRLVTGGADGKLTIRSATDGKPLAEMHNLGGGYLWTLCVDQEKRPGQQWFWTDRDDLIEVHRNDAGIECVIPWSHPEHADFIELHNDRIATLSMAGLCRDLPPDGFDKGPAAPDIAGLLA